MAALAPLQITTAVSNQLVDKVIEGITNMNRLSLAAVFVSGGGGTSVKAYVQTSLDGGSTWFDIACFAFTSGNENKYLACSFREGVSAAVALTTGTLADNTAINGLFGDRFKVVVTSAGTWNSGTSLTIHHYENN